MGPTLVVVHGSLIAVASYCGAQALGYSGFSSYGSRAPERIKEFGVLLSLGYGARGRHFRLPLRALSERCTRGFQSVGEEMFSLAKSENASRRN